MPPIPSPRASALRAAALGMVLALSVPLSGAPSGKVAFRAYGAEQGLGNLAVWKLLQDQTGFLWVGTEDGLYRFDGRHFQGFGAREGLPSTFVDSLHQEEDGTLWAGTFTGLARWDGRGFRKVLPEEGLPASPIKALATSRDGTLWVGTPRGLFRRPPGGTFVLERAWPGGGVTALWASPFQDGVWAAAWTDHGSRLFRGEGGRWLQAKASPDFREEPIQALAVDAKGTVWARTLGGLWSLPSGAGVFSALQPPIPGVGQRGSLSLDGQGRIRVTTDEGIYSFQADGRPQRLGTLEGLPDNWASCTLNDKEGSLWVAGNGLYRLLGGGAWQSYTRENGFPADLVWTVWRDRSGTLFAGTDRGLVRETPEGWDPVPGPARMSIRSIVQDATGACFLAAGAEVVRWDPARGTFARFGTAAGVRSSGDRIFRLLLDPQGALWVATDGGGLLRGTGKGDSWTFRRETLPGGDGQERIMDLHRDAAGRLWVAGSRGIAMLENGRWRRFTTADGLLHDHVAYLTTTRNGMLLAAYFEPLGLSRATFDPATGRLGVLDHLNAANGLASDKIYLMGEDARGNLWVGSGKGVDLLAPGRPVEHFGRTEGLVGDDTNSMAFLADASGDVWIGTSRGLGRFCAARYPGPPRPPATAILDTRLGGRSLLPEEPRVGRHATNTFEVSYAGLSYRREGSVQYQVRLADLEPEWRITEERSARYPGLAPGRYLFEVRARVGHGDWGPVAGISFEILPAWWETRWFHVLELLAGAGFLALAIRWRDLALRRHNRHLESMVLQRTREVEAKARELEAANEALRTQSLTDPLTGLRNRRFLGVCMPEDVAQVQRVHRTVGGEARARMHLNIDLIFLMVDIDHFKQVNDEHGHGAGDLVLQQMAAVLRQATRATDTVIRWGGEEFLVVARNAAREDSTILAERVRAMVAEHPFDLGNGHTMHRTCSVGFTHFPFCCGSAELFTWEQTVDMADHCLYAAKRGGRDAWVGLIPSAAAELDRLRGCLPMEIPLLLEEGMVEVLCHQRPGFKPDWEVEP